MNLKVEQNQKAHAPTLRKTAQYLMPAQRSGPSHTAEAYNIYPAFALDANKIFNGYESLATWIIEKKEVVIDGYVGVFWDQVQAAINNCLKAQGHSVNWIQTSMFLKSPEAIENLVAPFLGAGDAVWGTKCTLDLADFYDTASLEKQVPDHTQSINILIGPGAALANWDAAILYIDLPKNELQFRMRAGAVGNLGTDKVLEPYLMYKRFYFVDWVLLNKHKKALLSRINAIADGQWPDTINWMHQADLLSGLQQMSKSVIRVRPWFEPGAWGGQWLKNRIKDLNKDVVNYAWSFELISPENGLVFESDGNLLEVSFDMLMFQHQQQVLGKHAGKFGDEFPIRFDFLDTVKGGNLSIQCHPGLQYIQENFGENITQDETYYILDCEDSAKVYLGFQDDINSEAFRSTLENSQQNGVEVDIEQYVQAFGAKKHDLFLIPNSTVHSAGSGNLVLEISATPYIFTFKMYDWLRLDLDGKPRPINIEHAFKNLDFSRKGAQVSRQLIANPRVTDAGACWEIVHLPTHPEHFYDVQRLEFDAHISVATQDTCHVLMLVEGAALRIETADGTIHQYAYAETFIVPAAAQSYRLTNLGAGRAKVIQAFLK
jgi:mannose-6-phosphate isomerase class I